MKRNIQLAIFSVCLLVASAAQAEFTASDLPPECPPSLLAKIEQKKADSNKSIKAAANILKEELNKLGDLIEGKASAVNRSGGKSGKIQTALNATVASITTEKAALDAANAKFTACGSNAACKRTELRPVKQLTKKVAKLEKKKIGQIRALTLEAKKLDKRITSFENKISDSKSTAAGLCKDIAQDLELTPGLSNAPVATLVPSMNSVPPGSAISIQGRYTDVDGNLYKATIRVLGSGNYEGNMGVFPSIGVAGDAISGASYTLTRVFTIPVNAANGKFWFRTEVVDKANNSHIAWSYVDVRAVATPDAIGAAPVATLVPVVNNVSPGDAISIQGRYTDADGNLYKATIRVLGVGNFEGNLGVFPAIGAAGDTISGSTFTLTRVYTIPLNAAPGKLWFRTEVVDNTNNSHIAWAYVNVRDVGSNGGEGAAPSAELNFSHFMPYPGTTITITGNYKDADGNLYKASIRALGSGGNKQGDVGEYSPIGQAGQEINVNGNQTFESSMTRNFTIPRNASGVYWFRTEVVDTKGNSHIKWFPLALSDSVTPNQGNAPVASISVSVNGSGSAGVCSPGQTVTIDASYTDIDGNLFKASIRDLGTGNKSGDLGVFPAIGPAGQEIIGKNAGLSRTFTIPANTPSGPYWFRTEVVDFDGRSDIKWASIRVQ